ncbi:MAG: hypothetical protein ACYDCL_17950 [Myxococcales bacterium]
MRPAALPALLGLAACQLCKPTPPPPGPCTSDAACATGTACIAGSCQSLSQVLQNLSAVVWPTTPGLAPQEYQSLDGTQASLTLDLTAPQSWSGVFPLPPSCQPQGDPFEALPVTFRFTGHPFIPTLDWTFQFETDSAGRFDFALPANERFDVLIAPAVPCAAPYAGATDLSVSGLAPPPALPGSPPESPADVLTVTGAISAPDGAPLSARVTLLGAQGRYAGLPLSATATTRTTSSRPGGFTLPIPLAQVLAPPGTDGGSCAPPPIDPGCDGGACAPLQSCALFTLEVGPSPEEPSLPTVDIPVVTRIDPPPPDDGGVAGGPTASLWGVDGDGVRLPVGPNQLVSVSGAVVLESGGQPLASAEVTLACQGPDGGDACEAGFRFSATVLASGSEQDPGSFILSAPPHRSYLLTATPPPGLGLAPVTVPVAVGDGGVSGLSLPVPAGFQLTGTVFDPTGANPVGGEVQALELATGLLIGNGPVQSDGTFRLVLPPADYLLVLHPDPTTGLPDRSEPLTLQGDRDLGPITLFSGGRLQGGVFGEPLDGGPFPVAGASLTFYFVSLTPAFGTVALPIASGVTDAQGHFSVAAPSSAPPGD